MLFDLLRTEEPHVELPREQLRFLTSAGIACRYPGETADHKEASTALEIATSLRRELLPLLKEPQ